MGVCRGGWVRCVQDGKLVGGDFEREWPGEVDKERFRSAFRRYARDRNIRGWIPDDRSIGHQIKKFAPSVHVGRLQAGPTYKLPTLDVARGDWCLYIGHEVVWE